MSVSALLADTLIICCRQYVQQDKLPDVLGKYLKTDSFTTVNCRQALHKRMLKVQQQVAAHRKFVAKQSETIPLRMHKSSGVICVIFKAIKNEHPYLLSASLPLKIPPTPLPPSLIPPSLTHSSLTHSLTHSFTHSLTHSILHSLTHHGPKYYPLYLVPIIPIIPSHFVIRHQCILMPICLFMHLSIASCVSKLFSQSAAMSDKC